MRMDSARRVRERERDRNRKGREREGGTEMS